MMMDMVDCAILVNKDASVLAESMLDTLNRDGVILSEGADEDGYDPFNIDPEMVVDTYTAYDAPDEFDMVGQDATDYLEADEDISVGDGYGDIIDTMANLY